MEDLFREYLEPSCDNKNKQNGFELTKAVLELAKHSRSDNASYIHTNRKNIFELTMGNDNRICEFATRYVFVDELFFFRNETIVEGNVD